jgi:hypothetical protein
MKAILRACLLALPLLAAPTLAHAWCCCPTHIDAGISGHLNCCPGCCGTQLGPWYSYFPYNAHFQTPAPVGGWPYWPTGAPASIPPNGILTDTSTGTPVVQPAGYYGAAPTYWYGR